MTQVRHPKGFKHAQYKGGQYGHRIHDEPIGQLDDPPRIQTMNELLERRREALANQGYVPPAALTVDRSADRAARWWETQHLNAEHGHRQGDYPMLPETDPSSGRRTVRARYEGAGVALRMPSVAAIRRFDKEIDGTFDVPVSASFQGGEVTGWVRVTRNGDRWATKGLGFSDTADAQVAEAMAAVLEARRPTRALREAGDLIERRRARAFTGAPFRPVRSAWIQGLAYEQSSNTMVMRTKTGHTYGYQINRETYEAVLRAESPGAAYNRLVKHKTKRSAVTQCDSCGRFSSTGQPHSCPTGHRDRPGSASAWTEARDRIRSALTRRRQDPPADTEPSDPGPTDTTPPAPADPDPVVEPPAPPAVPQDKLLERVRARRARQREQRDQAAADAVARNQIKDSARHWGSRYNIDPHELAQEVAENWWKRLKQQEAAAANGQSVSIPENIRGYIHRTTQNIAIVTATGFKRSEDRKAAGLLRERCESQEFVLGRPLTNAEIDRLAEEIRASMPKRRRPTKGFHTRDAFKNTLSADLLANVLAEPEATTTSTPTDTWDADRVADRVSQIGRPAARKMAWNTVADITGAPTTAPGRLSNNQATRARRAIRNLGGVEAAIQAWREERLSDDHTAALFAPFGDTSFGAQERVIDTLETNRAYASAMWGAAVAAAVQ